MMNSLQILKFICNNKIERTGARKVLKMTTWLEIIIIWCANEPHTCRLHQSRNSVPDPQQLHPNRSIPPMPRPLSGKNRDPCEDWFRECPHQGRLEHRVSECEVFHRRQASRECPGRNWYGSPETHGYKYSCYFYNKFALKTWLMIYFSIFKHFQTFWMSRALSRRSNQSTPARENLKDDKIDCIIASRSYRHSWIRFFIPYQIIHWISIIKRYIYNWKT